MRSSGAVGRVARRDVIAAVLPDRYPLSSDLEVYLRDGHGLGRMFDYAVIGSRLQRLCDWSAQELEHPVCGS
jgi:hypothetical protein